MTIAEFVDSRLDMMLAHPNNWGSTEAFELQVLLLLELQMVLRCADVPRDSLRILLDAYASFMRKQRPDLGPRPVSTVLPNDPATISRYLEEFRESLESKLLPEPEESIPTAPTDLGTDIPVDPSSSKMPRAAQLPA